MSSVVRKIGANESDLVVGLAGWEGHGFSSAGTGQKE
jgi:hypothetical protein